MFASDDLSHLNIEKKQNVNRPEHFFQITLPRCVTIDTFAGEHCRPPVVDLSRPPQPKTDAAVSALLCIHVYVTLIGESAPSAP